jgi:hypothetical protein
MRIKIMSAVGKRSPMTPRTKHKVVSERVTASLMKDHPEFFNRPKITREQRDAIMKAKFEEFKKNKQPVMRFQQVGDAFKKQELMGEIRRRSSDVVKF